ncbi:MAG TPA: C25 family cysteine peptidase, partial [bacterium]
HIPDAEYIAERLIPPNYNVKKIYLTEYPAIHDATISGIRKPAAREALVKQINKGNLIINFIGHGNEQLWTHERIFVLSDDLPLIDNGQKQAFWIAATCNFGRFDNPDFQSFSEQLTTIANKGAIAVFSPCRLADAAQNVSLNEAIYRYLFSQDKRPNRIGDMVLLAKNSLGNSENSQFYNLLGDPTLRLTMPSCTVNIDEHQPDSLKALCRMEVGGSVEHFISGTSQSEGQILFEAFDSRKDRAYRVNEWRNYYYKLPGNTIFRGIATCTDEQFQVRFIVPKDITYGGKEGRFNVFYWNNNNFGSGYLNNIAVGGTGKNISDTDGPMIRIGFNGQSLTNHENVPANPMLYLTIADSVSGVNIAGDIGHEIAMVLDDAQEKQIILNDFFQYDKDSYLAGNITYPLGNLSEGMHSIQVKAWDNNNNSSHFEAGFTIVSLDKLVLHDVFNFPNPFAAATDFTFWVNQDCDVAIKVYTLSGRLICRLDNLSATSGFNHIFWNGEDGDGNILANGVYLYKVKANHDRSQAERIEKCVIMR